MIDGSIRTLEKLETKPSQSYFLLCGSCFWCASYFKLHSIIEICPSCKNGKVGSMPLSINQISEIGMTKI